ncbi:MAG: 2-C-methyl-D-erythritol 4-phosphate cytidylyltransferase [Gammaproteobacteria bacterium]
MSNTYKNQYFAIIPAAGKGSRMGSDIPKQYLKILSKTMLEYSLQALVDVPLIKTIMVVLSRNDRLPFALPSRVKTAVGGNARHHSVLNGLLALKEAQPLDWILVHDAARPCLNPLDVIKLINTVGNHPVGGCLGSPVRDTLKYCLKGQIQKTVSRENVWQVFTPQMFRYGALCSVLHSIAQDASAITDDASAIEQSGAMPLMVQGRADNIKVTYPEDLAFVAHILNKQRSP